MAKTDTIAAVSTPTGDGGIGIVRVSGPAALDVASRVFTPARGGQRPKSLSENIEPKRLVFGEIHTPGGEPVDRGFLVFMKGPRSYTGEDTVELQAHGGAMVIKKVLEAAIKAGARLADPGEFTRRAFLNGKLDLAQAEAVIDVIRAETDLALESARGRLEGVFSREVDSIKEPLAGLLARVEAELDFPEEEEVEGLPDRLITDETSRAGARIMEMLATFDEGMVLKEGLATVILGRPNVGKSSLLNLLLKTERAIVTPVPGTTRDVIEEVVDIRGLPVRLMDTAGLRHTTDHVESIGVERAREKARAAALVLFVVDSTSTGFTEDKKLLDSAEGVKTIVVANKFDLAAPEDEERVRSAFTGERVVFVSATEGAGLDELKDAVFEAATNRSPAKPDAGPTRPGALEGTHPGRLVASLRHKVSLEKAAAALERANAAVAEGLGREFVATDLRCALDHLGEITGETTTDDILDRIFSEFCVGK